MDHGGCRIGTRRESTRAVFRLLQHGQKNSGIASVNVYSDTVRHDASQSHDQNRIVDMQARLSSQTFPHFAEIEKDTMK
jgi:hypothetical protein